MTTTLYSSQPTSSRVSLKRKRVVCSNITDNIANSSLLPARKIVRVVSSVPDSILKAPLNQDSPRSVLQSIVSEQGMNSRAYRYDQLPHNFFVNAKDEDMKSWDFDVLKAVREGDVETLRTFHASGRPLHCSNRFNESLLHIACRKGLVDVIDFLINGVGVPTQIVDDMGRTPLHDAFWTPKPNPEVIDLLLSKSSDLLFVEDKRGHTPLDYSRKAHWGQWSDYLRSRSDLLLQQSTLIASKQ